MRLKDDALKAEAEHEKQKALYLEEIRRLHEELLATRKAQATEKRALDFLKEEQDKTRRMIARERAEFVRKIEEAAQLSAQQRAP